MHEKSSSSKMKAKLSQRGCLEDAYRPQEQWVFQGASRCVKDPRRKYVMLILGILTNFLCSQCQKKTFFGRPDLILKFSIFSDFRQLTLAGIYFFATLRGYRPKKWSPGEFKTGHAVTKTVTKAPFFLKTKIFKVEQKMKQKLFE